MAGGVFVSSPALGAGSARVTVSLSAPASATYGSTISLSGRIVRRGTTTAVRGGTVRLQRSIHGRGRFSNLASTRTSSTGAFKFSIVQQGAFDYRAYYAGSGTYAPAYSPVRYPVTYQKVVFDSIMTTDPDSGQLTAIGRVFPTPPAGTAVYLQRYSTDARTWVTTGFGRYQSGRVVIKVNLPGSVAAYRLMVGARSPYGAGISTAKSYAHYVWRSAYARRFKRVNTSGQVTIADDPGGSANKANFIGSTVASILIVMPDISGCVNFKATTHNNQSTVAPIQLRVASDALSGPNQTISLGANAGDEARFEEKSVAGGTYVQYQIVAGHEDVFNVTTSMQLECSN
ncbi:hypothetical protein [Kribbella sp. NPDC004536]|uniref:hypothetical protein n=1 Tax=Kribbella sp. NPDC004536 TaxID=3364106 RepID=UPI0036AB60A1